MAPSPWVRDVSDAAFGHDVVDRSSVVPVVVDFWAPWCGPCRTLGPVLERLAYEHAGAFELAKVNVDDAPETAAAHRIQSIPAVKGYRDGVVVTEFLGAQPESVVRHFLADLLPTDADRLVADAADLSPAAAEAKLVAALAIDPRHGAALLALARLCSEQHRDAEALELLPLVASTAPMAPEAERLAAVLRTRLHGGGNEADLRARLATDPGDLGARLGLGRALAARGRYEAALDELLTVVRTDRAFRDDDGRKAMLDIFEMLGPNDMLTQRYQSELAKVLFR
jgi:putative thioredoxin